MELRKNADNMKTIRLLLSVGIILSLILSSCTIVKRTYMPGWYVDRINSKHLPSKNESGLSEHEKISPEPLQEKIIRQDDAVTALLNTTEEIIIASPNKITKEKKPLSAQVVKQAGLKQISKHIAPLYFKKDKRGWFATVIIGILFICLAFGCALLYGGEVGLILYSIFGIVGLLFILLGIGQLIFA